MNQRLRSAYIVTTSVLVTAGYATWLMLVHLLTKQSRQWTDSKIASWANKMLKIANVQYRIVNPNQVAPKPNHPTIIMCNHSSNYDIPLSYKVFKQSSIRMLAKKELSRIPVLCKAMNSLEFVFIDRKNRTQAVKDLAKAQSIMESGIVMWISPEGTRSRKGELLKFKKGGFIMAINAKATIIPIGIRGAYDIMKPKSWMLNTAPIAEVHVGEPIDASAFTLENKDELVKLTREQIAQLSGEVKVEDNANH